MSPIRRHRNRSAHGFIDAVPRLATRIISDKAHGRSFPIISNEPILNTASKVLSAKGRCCALTASAGTWFANPWFGSIFVDGMEIFPEFKGYYSNIPVFCQDSGNLAGSGPSSTRMPGWILTAWIKGNAISSDPGPRGFRFSISKKGFFFTLRFISYPLTDWGESRVYRAVNAIPSDLCPWMIALLFIATNPFYMYDSGLNPHF